MPHRILLGLLLSVAIPAQAQPLIIDSVEIVSLAQPPLPTIPLQPVALPLSWSLMFRLAADALARLELERAADWFEAFIEQAGPEHPDSGTAIYNSAHTWGVLGEHERAEEGYTRYARMYPDAEDAAAVLFMAAAHWEQVDVQQSRRAYQHYLSQYSDTDLALTILAHHRLSVLVDEPHQAARHQEALLAAFAQHPGAAGPRSSHLAGMAALSGLEESARAARDLESLAQLVDTEQVWGDARQRVETDNNDIEAYLMLGRLYLERRDPLRARALAQTAQSTLVGAADAPGLIAIVAWSRWLEDDTGAAIAGLERASRMDPADAWIASRLTAVRMTQHDWEGALATATRPLDRGICLHWLGRLDEAEAAYQQATQASPQAPQPVHNLAVLYTQQNRASDAATSIRTFRQLGGNPVAAQALEEALP